jgi:glucosylceramidase
VAALGRRLVGVGVAALVSLLGAASPAAARSKIAYGPRVGVVQTSADLHQALTTLPAVRFSSRPVPPGPLITINSGVRYQPFRGAGGALTDSSAWLVGTRLRPGARARLLRQLFGSRGINLNLIRVPIGAADFTAGRASYSYDDVPAGQTDPTLSHFSVAHDLPYVIPVLRQAKALAERPFVLASPWSPPGWMKTNDSMDNSGGRGRLLPGKDGVLAQYLVRFLQAYQQAGVPIQALTPQNEPGQQSTYPGLAETAADEASFISDALSPALRQAGLRTRIFGFDSNWAGEAQFAGTLLGSPAAPDLAGLATHCYYGSPTVMATVHRLAPTLEQIVSECAPGGLSFPVPELEIGSLREWATGVELWNLALDPRGGPVQPPNFGCMGCRGIVAINPVTGGVHFGRTYYQLGQLTRFVAPGAVRIASNNFVTYRYPYLGADIASFGLDDVAFRNPGGREALVTYNGARAPVTFSVREGHRAFTTTLASGTMGTFTWRPARR